MALAYYTWLSRPLALGMLFVAATILAVTAWLESLAAPLWQTCTVIFLVSWVGQFVGHLLEKKSPSFFTDVQFLVIGRLWLLAQTYQRLGSRY